MGQPAFLPILGGAVLVALFIGAKTKPPIVKARGFFAEVWWELKWAAAAVIVIILYFTGIIGKIFG